MQALIHITFDSGSVLFDNVTSCVKSMCVFIFVYYINWNDLYIGTNKHV